jgi:hypothetical protein
MSDQEPVSGSDDPYCKTQQNTDRIARTARKVLAYRCFVRSVLFATAVRTRSPTDRHLKYRSLIDRAVIRAFAGLSP